MAKWDEVTATVRRCLLALLTSLTLVAGVVVASPAQAARPLVLVYGDSLVFEAEYYAKNILRDVAQVDFQVIGIPGAATCDLLPRMRQDAARLSPSLVVIAFSGNAQTTCMQDGNGHSLTGDAHIAKYRADNSEAVAIFRRNAPAIWFATAPISLMAQTQNSDGDRRMAAMLRDLAGSNRRVHVTDAGAAVLDTGRYAHTLPCLPKEPCQGGVDRMGRPANIVRAPDGGHFCPVVYVKGMTCPVHASGGLRFALGFLVQPLQSIGWYDAGRAANSMGAGFVPA